MPQKIIKQACGICSTEKKCLAFNASINTCQYNCSKIFTGLSPTPMGCPLCGYSKSLSNYSHFHQARPMIVIVEDTISFRRFLQYCTLGMIQGPQAAATYLMIYPLTCHSMQHSPIFYVLTVLSFNVLL